MNTKQTLTGWLSQRHKSVLDLMVLGVLIWTVKSAEMCSQHNNETTMQLVEHVKNSVNAVNALVEQSKELSHLTERQLGETQKVEQSILLAYQGQIRLELFLPLEKRWRELDAHHYPQNGRAYGEAEREVIREYFSRVVFHEWLTCWSLQNGVLRDEWKNYSKLIRGSLDAMPILCEEWAYFRAKEQKNLGSMGVRFVKEMDAMTRDVDCGKLLDEREKNIRRAEVLKSQGQGSVRESAIRLRAGKSGA